MAIYAVGDVQGCWSALRQLIQLIAFDPGRDQLWFVGDLVNRGPESAAVLRFVKGLGDAGIAVLGNHELHLLAVADGCVPIRRKDTFQDVMEASDRDDLLAWLRRRPLVHADRGYLLVHAGLLPQWTSRQAVGLAREGERALRAGSDYAFLATLGQHDLLAWSDDLPAAARLRLAIQAFTRLRVCTREGEPDHSFTGPPSEAPEGLMPWFDVPGRRSDDSTIVFGHWAALGLHLRDNLLGLDSGCVYGRRLTAVRLEDRQLFQVPGTRV